MLATLPCHGHGVLLAEGGGQMVNAQRLQSAKTCQIESWWLYYIERSILHVLPFYFKRSQKIKTDVQQMRAKGMQDVFLEVEIAWLPRCCLANLCFAFLAYAGYIWLYPALFTLHPRFRAFICDVWWVMVSIFCYLPMYRLFRGMNRLRLEYCLLTLFPWGCPLYVCLIYYRHTCIVVSYM